MEPDTPCTRCQQPVEPPTPYSRLHRRPDLCRSCRRLDAQRRYNQSEKNRAAQARYYQSEKGRTAIARIVQRQKGEQYRAWKAQYRRSEKGRATWERWTQTESGQASLERRRRHPNRRAFVDRYQQTEVGRANLLKHSARRRARKRGAMILEAIDRRAIFSLDGGLCHLCDLPVDPESFHIDHVIPLSRKPIHAEFNSAVAHPACNVRKHARLRALSPSARARWQARRPEHLAILDQYLARLAA